MEENVQKIQDFFEYTLYKCDVFNMQGKTISEIAKNNVGIHSARISTPYVTLCSRIPSFIPSNLYNALYVDKTVIKLRCMRTTLHIVPVELAPIFHMATKRLRIQRVLNEMKKTNVSIEQCIATRRYLNKLSSSPMNVENLENKIMSSTTPTLTRLQAKTIIKYLWEDGFLCYVNASKKWECEKRQYAITKKFYHGLDLNSMTEEQATRQLFLMYIRQYGPATLKDASWWSGIRQNTIKTVFDSAPHIIQLTMDNNTYYMYKDEYEQFKTFDTNKPYLKLLAYEDSALKAYYQSRTRYASEKLTPKIFNIIGEVMPCIVYNGEIIGKWAWNKQHNTIDTTLFKSGATIQKLLKKEITTYTQKLASSMQLTLFE